MEELLNVQLSSIVKRLLQVLEVLYTGESKGRKYDLTSFQ
ncbi:NERD domain protein [Bacillus mycoides]|uniref:NERD domain protein n=1 Tax=Bacillus mycoides TaxID=1405 RepID=C2Y1H0_BACMY|nr:NERD domain protein [Bacillus mycoides]